MKKTSSIKLQEKIWRATNLHDMLNIFHDSLNDLDLFDGFTIECLDQDTRLFAFEHVKLPAEFSAFEDTYLNYTYSVDVFGEELANYEKGSCGIFSSDEMDSYKVNVQNMLHKLNLKSLAIVPMVVENQSGNLLFGTVTLLSQTRKIDQQDTAKVQKLLQYFLSPFYMALMNKQYSLKAGIIKAGLEEQQRFLELITEINNLTTLDQIYEIFAADFFRRFGFDSMGLFVVQNDQLVCTNFISNKPDDPRSVKWDEFRNNNSYELKPKDGAVAMSYIVNTHVFISDVQQILHLPMSEKDREGIEALGIPRSFLCMPMRNPTTNQPVGIIMAWNLDELVNISEDDIRIIERLSMFIVSAINNARLYSTVEEQRNEITESKKEIERLYEDLEKKAMTLNVMATTDGLTGLKNFAFFEDELRRRISEYRRCKGREFLSLVIVDIDHFKQFNDTYGHVAGNYALEEVSSEISKQTRAMDIACRYGGEEFIIILPKCNLDGAYGFAERLRLAIIKTTKNIQPGLDNITISLGCAEYSPNEEAEGFIKRADKALYTAKESGRNQSVISENSPAEQ